MLYSLASALCLVVGSAWAQLPDTSELPGTSTYVDQDLGIKFGQHAIEEADVTFRFAVPSPIPENTAFDVVLQVVATRELGWVGLAWGGHMIYNPLTVAWPNGDEVVISSRGAVTYYQPTPYANARLGLIPAGTFVNETHFQFTALCSGCSAWNDGFEDYLLDVDGPNMLAYAWSTLEVLEPSNPDSDFYRHEGTGYFNGDFSIAGNAMG